MRRYWFELVFPGHEPVHNRYEAWLGRAVAELETELDRIGSIVGLSDRGGRSGYGRRSCRLFPDIVGPVE